MPVTVIMQKKQNKNIFPINLKHILTAIEGEMIIKPLRLFAVSWMPV